MSEAKVCWLCKEPILETQDSMPSKTEDGVSITIHERCWEDLQDYNADMAGDDDEQEI